MKLDMISGERQLEFVKEFDYIREAGTEGEVRAAERIGLELEKMGLSPVMEEFEFEEFQVEKALFQVMEPYEKEYVVNGYAGSGSTGAEGVEAEFLYVENGDEISLSYAKGKIVLMNDAIRKEMYGKLLDAGVAGFMTVSGGPLDEGEDRCPAVRTLRGVEDAPVQGLDIHYKDAVELVERGASRVRMTLVQKKVKKISRNVRIRVEGTKKPEEILTLTAHFDSVPEGPGAYDNMAGCAVIMELCRYFVQNPAKRSLEFIWFGAEEKGLKGSLAYAKSHKDEFKNHLFNMNVDLAGQLIGGNRFGVTGDPSICQMLECMVKEAGMGVRFSNAIWGSDSNTFAWYGVPAMTLNRDGFGMHTRHDTQALISSWSLKRSAGLLGYVAQRLADMQVFPFVREIPANFKEELDAYFHVM